MTKDEYKHLREFTKRLLLITKRKWLDCDEVINDAYIKLIERKKDFNYNAILPIIGGMVKYRFPDRCLSLDAIYVKTVSFAETSKVCPRCPQHQEQPINNFTIRQRLANGVILHNKYCKKCVNAQFRELYLYRKKEDKQWHDTFLANARGRYHKKMVLIKKNPQLHKLYNEKRRKETNAYNRRKREEKIKNGWRPKETAIAVIAFDMQGNQAKRFVSIGAGARFFNSSVSHIISVLKGRRHTAGGYYWRYANAKEFNIPKHPPKKGLPGKQVMAIDKNGEIVMKFQSIKDAAGYFGGVRANYVKALKDKWRTAKGYYWRHCTPV